VLLLEMRSGQLMAKLGGWWLVLDPVAGGGQASIQLNFPRNISTSGLVSGE
jgi:hypothetical protein